jgi:hypothetical protein
MKIPPPTGQGGVMVVVVNKTRRLNIHKCLGSVVPFAANAKRRIIIYIKAEAKRLNIRNTKYEIRKGRTINNN